MKGTLVKTGYIASGNGTDFEACMEAYLKNKHDLRELIKPKVLIVTDKNAGAVQKGKKYKKYNLQVEVVDYNNIGGYELFNARIAEIAKEKELRILLSVGCKQRLKPIASFPGNPFWLGNIHPADLEEDGGNNMYALEPHRHRLDRAADLVWRGRAKVSDKFITKIVVHSIEPGEGFDQGRILVDKLVLIPKQIIASYYDVFARVKNIVKSLRKLNPNIGGMWPIENLNQLYKKHHELLLEGDKIVKELQSFVLEKEHKLLPYALSLAAKKIKREMY